MAKAIGTLGNVDSVTVGGRTFVDVTNLIILEGGGGAANDKCTFRRGATASSYAAVNTLTIGAWKVVVTTVTPQAGVIFKLSYNDTNVGVAPGGAFTNNVFYGGDTGNSGLGWYTTATANENKIEGAIYFPVPTTKYVVMNQELATTSIRITLYGYDA